MNKQEFFKFHINFTRQMLEISQKKNADYTGEDSCPFANFTAVERNGIATTEQGFLTRMMDKMQRINSYAQQGKLEVADEKVEDTLQDLANYCILMSAYIRSKHDKEGNTVCEVTTPEVGKWYAVPRGSLHSEEYPA